MTAQPGGREETTQGAARRLTVLQCKFDAWLSWSQPFIHNLVTGVGREVRNVVVCNRTENLHRFPVQDVVRLRLRYLTEPRLAPLAADHIRSRWNPDLIHAHFGWSGADMLLLKQCLRIPLIVSFGGRDVGLQMKLPYFDRLYQVLLDATDQAICVSKDLERKLIDVGVEPERIRVIYRGVDVREFAFVDRSSRPADHPVTVLMVGRMVEKKGHRNAFAALAPLVREGLDVHLVVLGEGEMYGALRRLRRQLGLKQNIEFLKPTDHAGVRKQMGNADLLLHSSVTPESGDTEGIPNVIVEAQATGIPILGTRHGGIVEAVRDGETGILVPEHDVPAMTEALRTLVKNRELRLSMGSAARRFVESHLNFDTQVAEHLGIYRNLVERCGRDPEWARRVWIPDDYGELVDKTLRMGQEFSLAELAERLFWSRRIDEEFSEAPAGESALEKIYALKRHIPQGIKYPAKIALGKMLVKAIGLSKRRK